jgi:hypothetical protein
MSFPYLDLAIGMSFIFLLLAVTCTTVTEAIAGILTSRGKTLERGIAELLQDTELKDKLYAHPLIQGIESKSGQKSRLPSYISPNKFALALMDILTGPSAANDVAALRAGVSALENPATKQLLTAVLENPKYATDEQRLEARYEAGMNRVSGWYKRTAQIRVYALAVLLTLLMNADSRKMLTTLWKNPTMTAIAEESAKVELRKGKPPGTVSADEKKLLGPGGAKPEREEPMVRLTLVLREARRRRSTRLSSGFFATRLVKQCW